MNHWRKQTYTLAGRWPAGESNQVQGLVCGNFGVHKIPVDQYAADRRPYRLTHVPTGRKLGDFDRQGDARHAATRLEGLADWGFTVDDTFTRFTDTQRELFCRILRDPFGGV